MKILKSSYNDIPFIYKLYEAATALMASKGQVTWPTFEKQLVQCAIDEGRQWKIILENKIACIWTYTYDDEAIWGDRNQDPSLYVHRIATDQQFKGRNLVSHVINWSTKHAQSKNLKYLRLDTVGLNKGLIKHYEKNGFTFLGTKQLENLDALPDHYSKGPVCLFQKSIPTPNFNYNNRQFRPVKNSENGETSKDTIFQYAQKGNILTSTYKGGDIVSGHLIGLVDQNGTINMRYHQVNKKGELMTGTCTSKPEILENGKIRLHETWKWTSGDNSEGYSILEEI